MEGRDGEASRKREPVRQMTMDQETLVGKRGGKMHSASKSPTSIAASSA